jgi:di/tripeptidase
LPGAPTVGAQNERRLLHGRLGITLESAAGVLVGDELLGLVHHHELVSRQQSESAQFVEQIDGSDRGAIQVKARNLAKLLVQRGVKAPQSLHDQKGVLSVQDHDAHRGCEWFGHRVGFRGGAW